MIDICPANVVTCIAQHREKLLFPLDRQLNYTPRPQDDCRDMLQQVRCLASNQSEERLKVRFNERVAAQYCCNFDHCSTKSADLRPKPVAAALFFVRQQQQQQTEAATDHPASCGALQHLAALCGGITPQTQPLWRRIAGFEAKTNCSGAFFSRHRHRHKRHQ